MIEFLEKSLPKEVELFLFVPREYREKYSSTRAKIVTTKCSKKKCFSELRKFCRKNKIDRIFSMGALPQEGFVMAFASAFTKTDFICHLVVNPFNAFQTFDRKGIKAFFEFLLLFPIVAISKKFYVNSKDTTLLAKKFFPFAKNQIHFLKYIIDTKTYHPKDKLNSRKKMNLPLESKILVFAGRIEEAKGSDIILELAKKNSEKIFIMIGQLFDKNIKQANLKNILIIPPQNMDNLLEYYNSADLCIFPSKTEGFPLVPREALACGTPALVSDITGLRMIEPAIKSPLNAEEFNKRLNNFFTLSPKEIKNLSLKSRNFVVDECSFKVCKDLYIDKLLN
jgi:glycosyltransferase involved in cell wall biosynthesis